MNASINGIKMAFEDVGRGPAVIFLHGFPFNRHMWTPQIASLSKLGFRVIAPDLRGFGESEPGDKPFSIRTFSEDVSRLMKHLGIGRAVLVGMSLGGEVVLDLLRRQPRKVVATTILAPVLPPANAQEKIRYLNFAELIREGHQQTALDGFCQWAFPQGSTPPAEDLVGNLRPLMESVDMQTLASGMAFCAEAQKGVETGGHHKVPTLVLSGENDPVSPPDRTEALSENLPVSRRETIHGAGHMFNLEASPDLNQYLISFLDDVSHCKPGYLKLAADRVKSHLNIHFLNEIDEDDAEHQGALPV